MRIQIYFCNAIQYILQTFLVPPSLEAQVKNGIDLSNIEENEEVTLECLVEANPPVTSIQWTRDVSRKRMS